MFYNRKASEDKTLVVRGKPIQIVKASSIPEVTPGGPTNSQNEKTEKVRVVYVTVPAANGTTSTVSRKRQSAPQSGQTAPVPQGKVNRKSTSSEITPKDKETPASDRVFFPPYKFPFWGLPYGIYSNAGFINPGLFPFVPGGKYLTKYFT